MNCVNDSSCLGLGYLLIPDMKEGHCHFGGFEAVLPRNDLLKGGL